jgi:hypothetical protein
VSANPRKRILASPRLDDLRVRQQWAQQQRHPFPEQDVIVNQKNLHQGAFMTEAL